MKITVKSISKKVLACALVLMMVISYFSATLSVLAENAANSVTITLDAGTFGGTVDGKSTKTVTVAKNTPIKLSDSYTVAANDSKFSFVGWSTDKSDLVGEQTVTANGGETYYAIFREVRYVNSGAAANGNGLTPETPYWYIANATKSSGITSEVAVIVVSGTTAINTLGGARSSWQVSTNINSNIKHIYITSLDPTNGIDYRTEANGAACVEWYRSFQFDNYGYVSNPPFPSAISYTFNHTKFANTNLGSVQPYLYARGNDIIIGSDVDFLAVGSKLYSSGDTVLGEKLTADVTAAFSHLGDANGYALALSSDSQTISGNIYAEINSYIGPTLYMLRDASKLTGNATIVLNNAGFTNLFVMTNNITTQITGNVSVCFDGIDKTAQNQNANGFTMFNYMPNGSQIGGAINYIFNNGTYEHAFGENKIYSNVMLNYCGTTVGIIPTNGFYKINSAKGGIVRPADNESGSGKFEITTDADYIIINGTEQIPVTAKTAVYDLSAYNTVATFDNTDWITIDYQSSPIVNFIVDGNVIKTVKGAAGETVAELPANPQKTGLKFIGWSETEGATTADDTITFGENNSIKNFYAIWKDASAIIIDAATFGGTVNGEESITLAGTNAGSVVDALKDYTFVANNSKFSFVGLSKDPTAPVGELEITLELGTTYYAIFREVRYVDFTAASNGNGLTPDTPYWYMSNATKSTGITSEVAVIVVSGTASVNSLGGARNSWQLGTNVNSNIKQLYITSLDPTTNIDYRTKENGAACLEWFRSFQFNNYGADPSLSDLMFNFNHVRFANTYAGGSVESYLYARGSDVIIGDDVDFLPKDSVLYSAGDIILGSALTADVKTTLSHLGDTGGIAMKLINDAKAYKGNIYAEINSYIGNDYYLLSDSSTLDGSMTFIVNNIGFRVVTLLAGANNRATGNLSLCFDNVSESSFDHFYVYNKATDGSKIGGSINYIFNNNSYNASDIKYMYLNMTNASTDNNTIPTKGYYKINSSVGGTVRSVDGAENAGLFEITLDSGYDYVMINGEEVSANQNGYYDLTALCDTSKTFGECKWIEITYGKYPESEKNVLTVPVNHKLALNTVTLDFAANSDVSGDAVEWASLRSVYGEISNNNFVAFAIGEQVVTATYNGETVNVKFRIVGSTDSPAGTVYRFANDGLRIAPKENNTEYTIKVIDNTKMLVQGSLTLTEGNYIGMVHTTADDSGKLYSFEAVHIDRVSITAQFSDKTDYVAALGSSIRLQEKDSNNVVTLSAGIRYIFRFSMIKKQDDTVAILSDKIVIDGTEYPIVSVGTFVVPEALIYNGELNENTEMASNVEFKVVRNTTDEFSDVSVALVNIPDKMQYVDVAARSYVKYLDGETEKYFFGDIITRSYEELFEAAYPEYETPIEDTVYTDVLYGGTNHQLIGEEPYKYEIGEDIVFGFRTRGDYLLSYELYNSEDKDAPIDKGDVSGRTLKLTTSMETDGDVDLKLILKDKFGNIIKEFTFTVCVGNGDSSLGDLTFKERLTPVMGWSSWNALGGNISTTNLEMQMDALVSKGLANAGYIYFNIDDTYQNGRDETTGRLNIDLVKFPGGYADMKGIADRAHSLGLYAGIYTDAGDNSCHSGNTNPVGLGVGLYQHETDDLHMFLGDGIYRDTYAQNNANDAGIECWGYDFIKIDWCGGAHAGLNQETQYTKIGNIIADIRKEYNKEKIYNICCWAYQGPWQLQADSWRSGLDMHRQGSFDSVLQQVDIIKNISHLTGPGHVNDPDMLVVGKSMTAVEDQTHFAWWCMFSAPLVLGCDLTTISDETIELVTNEELIAINQDPACLSASFVGTIGTDVEVWVKDLGSANSDTKALMLVNRSDATQTVTYDFSNIGYIGNANIRDLLNKVDLEAASDLTVTLTSHQCAVVKLTPVETIPTILLKSTLEEVDALPDFTGTAGDDYFVFGETVNSVNNDIEATANKITVPGGEKEKTVSVYFEGSGDADFVIKMGGKLINKSVALDGSGKVLSVTYFSTDPDDELVITVNGDANLLAVALKTDVNVSGSGEISEVAGEVINLTELGNSDWYFYGRVKGISGIRKLGGGKQINVYATGGEEYQSSGDVIYNWTDGDFLASAKNIAGGRRTYETGESYEITLPANSTLRTVYVPLYMYGADVLVELIVGGEVLSTHSIAGAEATTVYKMFTGTYSATGDAVAKVRVTITNAYASNSFVALGGIALSTQTEEFAYTSIGANVENFVATNANADWITFGTNGTRKNGANILSDYYIADTTTVVSVDSGDKISEYGDEFELVLPHVSSLTRADINFSLKNAAVSVSVYTSGEAKQQIISDVTGGMDGVISVWYNESSNAAVRIRISGISATDAEFILKSISLNTGVDYIVGYPTLSVAGGNINSTLDIMSNNSLTLNVHTDFYNESGTLVSENSTPVATNSTVTEFNAVATIPTNFTSGIVKVYVTDNGGNVLGEISVFNYPLINSVLTADEEYRIGGLTAQYFAQNGAVLLDVRSAEEFATGSLDGAINIEYTDILSRAAELLPDKDAPIVCFCMTAKRSAQAIITLKSLGYTNVYNLGDMQQYLDAVADIELTDPSLQPWEEDDIINITLPNISRYDDVSVWYSVGGTSTFSDAVLYNDVEGVAIPETSESAFVIKAYMVLNASNAVICEKTVTYPILQAIPDESLIDYYISDNNPTSGGSFSGYTKMNTSVNGKTICIAGITFEKGIGMNASTVDGQPYVIADIPEGYKYFVAVVGKDQADGIGKNNTAVFNVYFDDVLAASSPTMSWDDYYVFKLVIPEGAKQIKLNVYGPADSNHCAWGNAGFMKAESTIIPNASDYNILEYMSDNISDNGIYVNTDASGNPINIADNTFSKGVGILVGTTENVIEYDIPVGANKFIATAGRTAGAADGITTTFSVYIDGVLAESCVLTNGEYYTFYTKIPTDAKKIRLVAVSSAEGDNYCAWGGAFFNAPRNIYISDNGSDTNDGLTPESPKKTADGALMVLEKGGYLIVTDVYTATISNFVATSDKVVKIKGLESTSRLVFQGGVQIRCDLVISDITVGRTNSVENPIRANGYDLTIGDNVTFDTSYVSGDSTANTGFIIAQNDYLEMTDINSVVSINSGILDAVYNGDNYFSVSGNSTVIIGGTAKVTMFALERNSSTSKKSVFTGRAEMIVNGGTVNYLYLGAHQRGGSDGVIRAQINGGKVGTIRLSGATGGNYTGSYSHEIVAQTGTNILEINGGTISNKTISLGGVIPSATRVVIFNNGMSTGMTVTDTDAIVVKSASNAGYVTALTDDTNMFSGLQIETDSESITVNGKVINDYETDENGKKVFTLSAFEKGTTVEISYN